MWSENVGIIVSPVLIVIIHYLILVSVIACADGGTNVLFDEIDCGSGRCVCTL